MKRLCDRCQEPAEDQARYGILTICPPCKHWFRVSKLRVKHALKRNRERAST
jgi:hypothetical protein